MFSTIADNSLYKCIYTCFPIFGLTWEKPRVVDGSRIQVVFSDIVQIPAIKAHIFFPLFEPSTVNQKPTQDSHNGQGLSIKKRKKEGTIRQKNIVGCQHWSLNLLVPAEIISLVRIPFNPKYSQQVNGLICTQVHFPKESQSLSDDI